ncbi:hypothetical protein [Parafrankia colletiae]|uniref:hypothetical protein n=1 Tax=Parafrankia colletiae TaxID=573497 RepID=UPI000A9BFB6F|nr:hypothetical protein [Parafrankia colletiae]
MTKGITMADVSVRLPADGGAEVVLNLSVLQAMRLIESITSRVADVMAAPGRAGTGAR